MAHLVDNNTVHQRVVGRLPVEKATGWMHYYRANCYSALIRTAKYNGYPALARKLGRLMAAELTADGFFDGIDVLLPVPMWWPKQWWRGYNQSVMVARGIADVTGIPVGDNLVARRYHSTQTRLGAFDRYINVKGSVAVAHPDELEGLHIMLVDDVITTGSTMSACIDALAEGADVKAVSVVAVGVTHLS